MLKFAKEHQISWHNKEPVLSVDIQQIDNVDAKFYRLASGGSDNHVLIWQLKIQENGAAAIELLSDLTRHQRSVNVVRWSPNGHYLASADDDANIIIWTLKLDNIPSLEGEDENKESWIVHKVLRGHKEDIYDMCWSPDGAKLLTGSIDNTAIVWDVNKGKNEHIITEHKSFVQGVAWNPAHFPPYMATLSSDRTCRILDTTSLRYQIRHRIARSTLPLPPLGESVVKLFHDDTFRTYFRRLTFTPDGTLLLVPSGYVEMAAEAEQERKVLFGTYVFPTTGSFTTPSAILVSPRQCTIAVRCCPLLFELRPSGPAPYVQLPYRMVFAIATDSDVVLYDTQQTAPFAHLQNIHYTRLTDLTWSPDGRILTAASTDGFCTIVTFDAEELGKVYVKEESEAEESAGLNVSCEIETEIASVVEKEAKKKKRPSFLEQWTKLGGTTVEDSEKKDREMSLPRKALFVNEAVNVKVLSGETKRNFDCEFIDLSSSLSNDCDKQKRRITPILLSSSSKKTPISDLSHAKTQRRITPTLLSAKSAATMLNSSKFASEVIDLTEDTEKGAKRSVTTTPTSAKKFKTNTLLSFIQRGPKIVQAAFSESAKVSEEENLTRNSWKCDETSSMISAEESTVDIPEDFKLQVEESNLTQPGISVDGVLIINDTEIDVKDKQNAVESSEVAVAKKENAVFKTIKTPPEVVVAAKRRVPLITLSSPKNKTKPSPTDSRNVL